MPNAKRTSKTRSRRRTAASDRPPCAEWLWREIAPFFRRPPLRGGRSARHLRNASIETLEAFRDLLDDMIEWLRQEEKRQPQMRRIRVQE